MGMIKIKTEHATLSCPTCGTVLAHNKPFGPPQVQCANCGQVLTTGLEYWYDPFPFPGRGRFLVSLQELFNPTALGVPGFMGYVIHFFVIYPLIFVFTFGFGLLYYPIYRLIKMVNEMKKFKETGVPPVWGKKGAAPAAKP